MQIKRRSISLLLILAMMTVALVSLLPLTAAADPVGDNSADIQDFSYQTLSNANQTDATTDLRVMFTIGSLDYDAVGFVFSTSNSAPAAGGAGTYSTTTVHSTINAGGGNVPAGPGRFWVAVKLSAIPLASFETPIYVRPFIRVGENYSYIDAAAITVCQALTYDKTVAGESEIFDFSNPSGPYFSYNNFEVSKTIADIRGDQHFFKTSGDDDWKDLYFEYSILWNPTLANTANARFSVASFKDCELFGFYTRDDNSWNEYAGHFDMNKTYVYGSKGMDGPEWESWEGTPYSCIQGKEKPYKGSLDTTVTAASYPAIGQYGWHRIGFVYDMSTQSNATKQNADTTHGVLYWATSSLYIDGVKVWEVRNSIQGWWNDNKMVNDVKTPGWESTNYALRPNFAMPWIAIKDGKTLTSQFVNGGIVYKGIHYAEIDDVTVKMIIRNISGATGDAFVAVSDVHWSCGGGFRRNVSPVADPVDRTIVLDDKGTADPSDDVTCSGKIWYVFDN